MKLRIRARYADWEWEPWGVWRVEWFPNGSPYLRRPHWHLRFHGGFRQNIPAHLYEVLEVCS